MGPDRRRELGGYIREQRSESRLSLRHLSQLAGVSNPYLSQIERGLRRPSAEILQRIARALHISAESLYVQAGILDESALDLVPCIRRDPRLTSEQKEQLERAYEEFVRSNGELVRANGEFDRAGDDRRAPAGGTAPIDR